MSVVDLLLQASFWLIFAAMAVTLVHLQRGPMLLDRVNALNMFGNLMVPLFMVLAVIFGDWLLLEVALVICLTSFIPIAALAHYLLRRYRK